MDQHNSHDAENKFKGKGRESSSPAPTRIEGEADTRNQQGEGDAQPEPSFSNRLATSVVNLSRAALAGRPDIGGLRSGTSSKAEASTGTNSAQDSGSRGQAAIYRGANGAVAGLGTAFSSSQNSDTGGERQYDGFMDAQTALDNSVQLQTPSELQPGFAGPGNISHSSRSWSVESDVKEQQARDGQQVIDLLNAPGESDGLDFMHDSIQTFVSPEEEESLREALFGSGGDITVSNWTPLLDFEPDFLQGNSATELQQHFGVADPRQARAMWVDGWNDVLTSYTDEVWGDLGSLAQEAHREIQEARGQGTLTTVDSGGMHALQRLRQILAHVRGH
ncbi:hypothetical protein CH063_00619 [Colletotrichum higginsianum]|uniref:Uncharacterized protein n=2 Tax=Colletotrichum higginsianum TaxID=80884 RepID=H1W215_COLHI|nr:hypothetical protein CH63R_11867 [Colletotrichum higginsianum IMI 349063]OBR05164.1 hypothetical protein CH63R_11867 [Colletotrichum higginsianum IMI 349063]TIC94149.1 hypothetical protein CH35J_009552 [Colletotrichum higginsianum]GJC99794.1 hypothetical protein ColKHC_08620 [Colletotrichum higginsianum]CCF46528.1 hypothetical protein CH063_00619 [Colletotrichum higginsianum]